MLKLYLVQEFRFFASFTLELSFWSLLSNWKLEISNMYCIVNFEILIAREVDMKTVEGRRAGGTNIRILADFKYDEQI